VLYGETVQNSGWEPKRGENLSPVASPIDAEGENAVKILLKWMIGIASIFVALMIYTVAYVFFLTYPAKALGVKLLVDGTIFSPLYWSLLVLVFGGTTWLFRYSVTRTVTGFRMRHDENQRSGTATAK